MDINKASLLLINIISEEKEVHTRHIARLLNISPTTASSILTKLYKNKILEVKQKGKNKIYSLRKSIITFKLLLLAKEYEAINFLESNFILKQFFEDLIKTIKEYTDSILVFGSYAKKIQTSKSDLDILVLIKNYSYIKKIDLLLKEFSNTYGTKLHQQIITLDDFKKNLDKPLNKEILTKNICIYGTETFLGEL